MDPNLKMFKFFPHNSVYFFKKIEAFWGLCPRDIILELEQNKSTLFILQAFLRLLERLQIGRVFAPWGVTFLVTMAISLENIKFLC